MHSVRTIANTAPLAPRRLAFAQIARSKLLGAAGSAHLILHVGRPLVQRPREPGNLRRPVGDVDPVRRGADAEWPSGRRIGHPAVTNLELFALDGVVTLMMAAALAPPVWAAIEDGRYNDQQQRVYREQLRTTAGHRPTTETSRAK